MSAPEERKMLQERLLEATEELVASSMELSDAEARKEQTKVESTRAEEEAWKASARFNKARAEYINATLAAVGVERKP
jgi:chromosome segregation ATPase